MKFKTNNKWNLCENIFLMIYVIYLWLTGVMNGTLGLVVYYSIIKVFTLIKSQTCLFVYLGFNVAFNTVQVISRRVVGRAEETST